MQGPLLAGPVFIFAYYLCRNATAAICLTKPFAISALAKPPDSSRYPDRPKILIDYNQLLEPPALGMGLDSVSMTPHASMSLRDVAR